MDVKEADFIIRDFAFASGETLPRQDSHRGSPLNIHYRTMGAPQRGADGEISNAVLLLHGTVGSGKQFLAPTTADHLFGPGQPLDTGKYFVILPDAIGHGGSSSPSNGLKSQFPKYNYGDMIQAQYRLITEGLGVKQLRLLVGTSMGGMQAWMWAEQYPDAMRAVLPIACVPGPVKGRNLLWRRMLIDMIVDDPAYHGGDYDVQPLTLGVAWNLFEMMAGSTERLEEKLTDIPAANAKIKESTKIALAEKDANDVVYEFGSSKDYDPSGSLAKIKAPLLAVNFADDQLNPVELGVLDRAIKRVAGGRAALIPTGPKSKGHQTLQVAELWAQHVQDLLDETAAPQRAARPAPVKGLIP